MTSQTNRRRCKCGRLLIGNEKTCYRCRKKYIDIKIRAYTEIVEEIGKPTAENLRAFQRLVKAREKQIQQEGE